MSEEYLREMRILERQQNDLTSQYDTKEENREIYDYKDITNANIEFTPHKSETWKDYSNRIKIYAKISAEKNRLTHIDGPRKAWYTHRNAAGCFMCQDTNLISVLVRIVSLMGAKYPKNTF